MGCLPHEGGVGRRLLAESIELQHRVALVPLPPEPPKGHPLLRHPAVIAVLLLAAAVSVLLPVTLIL